jgi:hypothetical protein
MRHTRNRAILQAAASAGFAFCLCVSNLGCGGNTDGSSAGPGADAGIDHGNVPDGDVVLLDGAIGPSPCVSSLGYAVCGGPSACFPSSQQTMQSQCWSCGQDYFNVGICMNAAEPNLPAGLYADDGEVYIEAFVPNVWNDFPYDIGALVASNGAPDRVRYADWYAWTGDPLPEPSTCPTFTGFSICGGNCDPCGSGELCTGRSPHHPYGLCLPDPSVNTTTACESSNSWSCPAGAGCVVLQSSTDGQPFADRNGLCMPSASCASIATSYPGGAICHGQ